MTKKNTQGMTMKTAEINFSKEDSSKQKKTITADAVTSLRSIRPPKSMVRVKSLRPKKVGGARRVIINTLETR